MFITPSEITEGARPGWKTVGVESVEGHTEYLSMEDRFLVYRSGQALLAVRIVARDPRHKTLLIQLPTEADSGANRVWVPDSALVDTISEAVV